MSRSTGPRIWRLGTGTRTVAITEQVATIIDVTDRELAERVWHAQLADGADGALELLLQGGMSAVPDFVLFEIEDDSLRAVIRGKAKVVSVGKDGLATYEGKDVRLAAEYLIVNPVAIHAGFVDTLPHLSPAATEALGGDGDRAAMMSIHCSIVSGFGTAGWIAVGEVAVTDGCSDWRDVDDRPTSGRVHVDATRDADAPPPGRLAEPTAGGSLVDGTDDTAADGPEPDQADPSHAGPHDPIDHPPAEESEPSRAHLQGAEPLLDHDLDDDGNRYASIFGATMQRTVMDAAVRSDADRDDGIEAGSVPIPEAESSHEPADGTPRAASPVGRRISVDTVPSTDLVDGHTLPPVDDRGPRQHEQSSVAQGDHDGHTISRADLGSVGATAAGSDPSHTRWNNGGQASASHSGPTVQSVRCADGHDNPPYRSDCGRCHRPLDGEPIAVPRPPLGTLTFSTGGEVVLDRPILVGRKPDVAGLICSEIPREVAVDVGDGLSRSHALFSIAGWQVRIEDLGSTNHTTIRLPDQPAQRLRAGEPVPITDGTLIDLGGEVTCRYDVNI